ncbi:hypothetical protein, variant [Magnaporthiopsis poae ATCC 64411]|uniref:Xylanolytic transcriptional activator regulatory domain-containing protein n=1 Tax=Magnaporthiopsis poae (strain ATCC 64411 / 73-15) TaxID=644358 RepID=A0A0C4E6Y8_MAGP6|nr:hypothetical protein, variant [Magnaporthiopsis poae ATCC 64411]
MQNRIDRLEGLVLALMHGGANLEASGAAAATTASSSVSAPHTGATPATTTTDGTSSARNDTCPNPDDTREDGDDDSDIEGGLSTSLGFLKVDQEKGKSIYIGQEHWHSILAGISEVKSYFNNHKKDLENSYEKVLKSKPPSALHGLSLLLGTEPAREVELRAELPPKSSVLTLCGRYFNSMDNAVNIVHAPTFYRMLQKHWEDPSKTPIMWLGMLYSILCLAMLSYHKVGDEPAEWKGRSLELAAEYRMRTVQCLVTGDYTKPSEYTVETLILYKFGEFSSLYDADVGLWMISALTTRVAIRMGYHRDAKWFPSITPFQGEMRRRTWALIRMCDIMFSLQVSLPAMIHDEDCDTQLPSNIFDEEFGPDTKVLPPSRPHTDPTPMAYMIAKVRLGLELGRIIQATTRIGVQVPYDEILRLDARLREVAAELPPHLKLQPLEGSHDPLTLIIARLNIDILVQKIFCLLHRNYLPRSRKNPRYAHSRRTAIEASMETLRHLETMHRESQGNGRLRSMRWFFTSVATREFLLPAMLVGLDLHYDNMAEKSGHRQDSQGLFFWTPQQRLQMVNTLEVTRQIWDGLKDTSVEAFKASNVLRILLEKINSPTPDPSGTDQDSAAATAAVAGQDGMGLFGGSSSAELRPEHSAAMTLGMLSGGGGLSPNTAAMLDPMQSPGGTTTYAAPPAMDVGGEESGQAPTAMSPDFNMDMYAGINNTASPFTSLMNAGSAMDFSSTAGFDWDAFESYAQTANFAPDSFQFIGSVAQIPGESTTDGSSSFAFNSPNGPEGEPSREYEKK